MNKEKPFIATILTLIVASTLLFASTHYVYAETLFEDNYESGDYSSWAGTLTASGSTMEISTTTVYDGVYAANCSLSSTLNTYAFAHCTLVRTETTIYHREYIQVSALPPSRSRTRPVWHNGRSPYSTSRNYSNW